MATAHQWLEGARLRTLPASTSPVLAGTALAWFTAVKAGPPFDADRLPTAIALLVLCLIVALGFQIGCNFANDYSDGVRGTDDFRVGPMRLVASGAAEPRAVKRAAWICFTIACGAGLVVVALAIRFFDSAWRLPTFSSGDWIIPIILVLVGLACLLAAWFYTGGRRPYGYVGLGEAFVFVFFGLVASIATTFVQSPLVPEDREIQVGCVPYHRDIAWAPTILMGVVMGCFSTAILVANNLRDLPSDSKAGKHTLAVRLGDRRTRAFYVLLIVIALAGLLVISALTSAFALMSVIGMALIVGSVVRVIRGASGMELVRVLKWTGFAQLATALFAGLGLGIGWFHG